MICMVKRNQQGHSWVFLMIMSNIHWNLCSLSSVTSSNQTIQLIKGFVTNFQVKSPGRTGNICFSADYLVNEICRSISKVMSSTPLMQLPPPRRIGNLWKFILLQKKITKRCQSQIISHRTTSHTMIKRQIDWAIKNHEVPASVEQFFTLPMAIAQTNGSPVTGTKSVTREFWETQYPDAFYFGKLPDNLFDTCCLVIDDMFIIHTMRTNQTSSLAFAKYLFLQMGHKQILIYSRWFYKQHLYWIWCPNAIFHHTHVLHSTTEGLCSRDRKHSNHVWYFWFQYFSRGLANVPLE